MRDKDLSIQDWRNLANVDLDEGISINIFDNINEVTYLKGLRDIFFNSGKSYKQSKPRLFVAMILMVQERLNFSIGQDAIDIGYEVYSEYPEFNNGFL